MLAASTKNKITRLKCLKPKCDIDIAMAFTTPSLRKLKELHDKWFAGYINIQGREYQVRGRGYRNV
jgi:hypothetical protein